MSAARPPLRRWTRPFAPVVVGEAAGQRLHGARGPGGGAGAGAVRQAVPVDRPGARDNAPHDGGGEQADTADVVLGLRSSALCNADAPAMYCPNAASIASV